MANLLGAKNTPPVELELIDKIIEQVCKYWNVLPDEMVAVKGIRSASNRINHARQIAMYLVREHTSAGITEIGRIFGRDHTVVSYACRRIAEELLRDATFIRQIAIVEQCAGLERVENRLMRLENEVAGDLLENLVGTA